MLDGWFVYCKGDESHEIYFIKSGSVRIDASDKETRFGIILKAGDFFGDEEVFTGERRSDYAKAIGTTDLCVLSRYNLRHILQRYPSVSDRIQTAMLSRPPL